MKTSAAQEHRGLLEAINSGHLPRFADGGAVSTPIAIPHDARAGPGGGAPQVNIHSPITINASGGTPEQNQDLAKQFSTQFERIARGVIVQELRAQMRPGNLLNR